MVKAVEELKAGDVIAIANNYDKYHVAMTDYNSSKYFNKIDVTFNNNAFVSNSSKISEITLENAKNGNYYLKCSLGYLTTTGSGKLVTTTTCTNENIATITFDEQYAKISFGDKNTLFICYNSGSPRYACYIGGKTSQQRYAQIYKKDIDKRQDTGIHFAKESYTADIAKGTFNEAELVNPNGLEVAYEITPKTEGVIIADDGTVTYPAVEATYTVTAKFAGNGTYKPATATYTLNVVDPNFEIQTIEFVAGVDKGTGADTNGIKDDMISKGIVTVSSTRACLGLEGKNYYAFYKPVDSNSGIHTISTRMGTITKIAFEAGNGKEPSKATFTEGTYTKDNDDTKNYTWTGSEKTINFTVTASTYYSKITVTVKVPVAKDYTLDENSVNTIEAYENANVTLTRKLVGDVWNTLSVPFSLSAEQAKEAFGDEVQLRELESVQDNTLNFKTVNSITAGVPCLIKLTKAFAKDTYTFTGVQTIAAKADDLAEGEVKGTISFIGIYSPTDVTKRASADKEYAVFLGAGNQFFKAQAGTEMKGFRAFFLVPNNVPNSAVKVVIDGTATGIEDLVIDGVKANGRVYNLNGQYVGNSLNGLQPGIYIQNGKKIVVK